MADGPTYYTSSLRSRLRTFGFRWFTVNMATGIIPLLFIRFIVGSETHGVRITALTLWILNFALFVLFCLLMTARFILHPDSWKNVFEHPFESLYTAAFPMAIAVQLSGCIAIFHNAFGWGGHRFLLILWGFWWFQNAVSYAVTFWITHLMISRFDFRIENMIALWMFPVVTLTVASTGGNVLAAVLFPYSPSEAWVTTIFSMVMLLIGLSFTLQQLTMFLQKLITSGLPKGLSIMTSFITLGPLSQSGYSFVLFAKGFQTQLPKPSSTSPFLRSELSGPILYAINLCAAFTLWAISTGWIVFAIMGVLQVARKEKIGFGPTYWALIFPNGVYAILSMELGDMVASRTFKVWGATIGVATLLTWLYIVIRVIHGQCKEELSFFRKPTRPAVVIEKTPGSTGSNDASGSPGSTGPSMDASMDGSTVHSMNINGSTAGFTGRTELV